MFYPFLKTVTRIKKITGVLITCWIVYLLLLMTHCQAEEQMDIPPNPTKDLSLTEVPTEVYDIDAITAATSAPIVLYKKDDTIEVQWVSKTSRWMNLSRMQIEKIEGLHWFPELEKLDLSCNHIHQIQGLEPAVQLKDLNLSCNRISYIEGLESLIHLKKLSLSCNLIETLEGLENLNNLEAVYINDNLIFQEACQKAKQDYPWINIYGCLQ